MSLALTKLRNEFDFLTCGVKPIAYLDNAATTQKPRVVIDRMSRFYAYENANVHRGVYRLSEHATHEYEAARATVAEFLGGVRSEEIIFTRGVTEALNLVASAWGRTYVNAGDEIVLSIAEHHSNIVPWQLVAQATGARLVFLPLTAECRLDMTRARELIGPKTKILAIQHVSNALGVIHPLKELIALAKAHGAISVVDGAQAVPHFNVDVLDLDCDFYAFSGHKMLGPTGIGCLYGRARLLETMPPYHGGGDMIESVTVDGFTCAEIPAKFEAGTPNIAGAIGLRATIDFLATAPRAEAIEHERELGRHLVEELRGNKHVRLFTPGGDDWIGTVTFYHEVIHPHDVAAFADQEGVCVRAGHHCAQPLMRALGVGSTSRVSPYLYNTHEDIERFIRALRKAEKKLIG